MPVAVVRLFEMNMLRAILVALPFVVLVACEPAGSAKEDHPATDPPLGPNDAGLAVDIVGSGTVTYDNGNLKPCAADGTPKTSCPPVRFDGGTGTVTARASSGWRFTGWSLKFGDASPNAIANPSDPSQTILPGTSVALVATFVPLIHPILATFTQQLFSTTYRLDIDNPELDIVKVKWSGPNCGEWSPQEEQLGAESKDHFEMTWKHPHTQGANGCDATTDHEDVKITATVTIKDKTFVCEYQGADTGTGPACR